MPAGLPVVASCDDDIGRSLFSDDAVAFTAADGSIERGVGMPVGSPGVAMGDDAAVGDAVVTTCGIPVGLTVTCDDDIWLSLLSDDAVAFTAAGDSVERGVGMPAGSPAVAMGDDEAVGDAVVTT